MAYDQVKQFNEDSVHADGDKGLHILAVRKDILSAQTDSDGDYSSLLTNQNGATWVIDENSPDMKSYLYSLATTVAGTELQVDVLSSALPTGAATLAEQQTQTASLSVLDDWDNAASDGASVSGDVAHDSADAGEPVKIGGKGLSADPTAVATADRVNALFDLLGKQVVLPYAIPESAVSGAITSAMTGTTSTSLVAAPGSGLRNYITTIIVSNAHGTVGTDVIIQDGSGGTTLLTIPAAALYGGAVITLPTPLRQPTTNTAIYCANVTTGASTKVSAVGYKAV